MPPDRSSCTTGPPIGEEMKEKCNWRSLDVLLLCSLIIGVWCVLLLPVIFYYLPTTEVPSNTSSNTSCSAPLQYATTSGICLEEFVSIQTSSNCELNPEGNVLVLRNEGDKVARLMNDLAVVGASAECINSAFPFLCQHVFGLCGESGVSIQPTSSQCEEISNTVCQQEWMLIKESNMDIPDCAMFPPEALPCPPLNDSLSTNEANASGNESFMNETTVTLFECSEGFYRETDSSVCTPSCYTWTQYNKGLSISIDVIELILTIVAMLTAIAVIVISCLVRKRMLILPSIFIVYLMIDTLIIGFCTLVSLLDIHNRLFCSSRNLIESSRKVTPFCVITGMVPLYTYCQSAIWWLFHIIFIFWKVVLPLHARFSGKVRYIHIACVLVGIILPLVPVITSVADFAVDIQEQNENSTSQFRKNLFLSRGLGFEATRFPPILCGTTNLDALFYSYILPINIGLGSGCTLIFIMVWSIHRLNKRSRMQPNTKFKVFKFGTAEKKLLFVVFYYLGLAVASLTSTTFSTRDPSKLIDNIQTYFFCEQGGYNASNSCSRAEINNRNIPALEIVPKFLVSMFPVVNLIYVVNIQELKELWTKWSNKKKSTLSTKQS